MKRLLVTQSNYIPWKGYFDAINSVDEFIIYDDVQYTKNDWRNRNKIKTPQGTQWLTIPVDVSGKMGQKINEAKVSEKQLNWRWVHWRALTYNYSKAPYFKDYQDLFQKHYLVENQEMNLSKINYSFIVLINEILGIKTPIKWSSEYTLIGGRNERLIDLCKQAGATDYYSGPAAKDYIQTDLFTKEGIKVRFFDYSGYPEYHQLYGPFEHAVSVLDLIFNEGPNAKNFMKSFLKMPMLEASNV